MAEKVKFQPQKFDINSINGGNRYGLEGIQPEAVNAPIEAAAYAQALATNQPNIENAGLVGTPSVSIEEVDGLPRFKFQNLKGEKGIDGKDHSEEIAQLNEKLETYFISAKEQIDINSEEISKNSAKIHNLTNILLENEQVAIAEVSQAFTTRQTADGENIIDNQNIFPKKIAGSTRNCYSLVDFSRAKSVDGVTVTANNNTLTISGTPTSSTSLFSADITSLLEDGKTYNTYQSVTFSSTSGAVSILVSIKNIETGAETFNHASATGGYTFVCDKSTYTYIVQIQLSSLDAINTTVSFMLYEGTDEKPYQPYFKGLKNAYFEKVVSTGRSLIDFSTAKKSVGGLTVTADNNTITISGKPTSHYQMIFDLDITDLLEDGETYNLYQSVPFTGKNERSSTYMQLQMIENNGTKTNVYSENASGRTSFVCDKTTYFRYRLLLQNRIVSDSLDVTVNSTNSFMFYKGTTILPYEPYTESELGFSSSPDLAVVEEVADDNLIYLSDMSNVHVGMLVDFYMDGTIISGATSREVLSVDIEEKSIVIDGADPMENVPVYTTVRRSAQVKLPEWDYILPQEQKIVRQTGFATSETGFTDDEIATYGETVVSADKLTLAYKLAEATEEDIVIPNNYTAYQGGLEKVVQGNTDNSEYGAMCTLTNDYFVKVGGATNEQTE